MAVITYNNLYGLARDNVILIEYDKNGETLNIQATLLSEHIPSSDENSRVRETSVNIGDWALSGDSDGALKFIDGTAFNAKDLSNTTHPDWIKLYSTNYQFWINFDISKIKSIVIVENP